MPRRTSQSAQEPRIELAPLLDVIFLLLTFFIYSIVVTVQANVLPVSLPSLSAAEAPTRSEIAGITVDAAGRFYLNQEPIRRQQLRRRLEEMAGRDEPPQVFVALEAEGGQVDRAPLLLDLINMLRGAGIDNFRIVGRRGEGGADGGGGGG